MSLNWWVGVAGLMFVLVSGCSSAEAEPGDDKPAATESKAGEVAKEDKKFIVPKDATTDELLDFIFELGQMPSPSSTKEGVTAHAMKVTNAILEATDKVLNTKGVSDRAALEALDWRISAYTVQADLEQKGAEKARLELLNKYKADSRPKFAALVKGKLLLINLERYSKMKPEEQAALVSDAVDYVKGTGLATQSTFKNATRLGKVFEEGGNDELAAKAFDGFADLFKHSLDPDAEFHGQLLRRMAERMRLVGKSMEIEGQFLSSKPIDWSSYRGKVVLVDFWATWCPKCVAELPDLVKLHEEYKAKGFDIVGVNMDSNRRLLDKFLSDNELPWDSLFTDEKEVHPLADKYGVVSLPVNMLVDKDGKVIKLNIHGEDLKATLEKLLGKPNDTKQK